jgi:hypothetical protein
MGAIASQFVANDYRITNFVSNSNELSKYVGSSNNIKLALLLIPPVLTAIFMVRTVKGGKLSPNIIPAIGIGLLAAFLVVPLLPESTLASITTNSVWVQLNKFQGIIIGISSLVVLVLLFLHRTKSYGSVSHHKHAKG